MALRMRCSGPAIKKFISVLTLSNVAAAATAASPYTFASAIASIVLSLGKNLDSSL